MSVGVKSLLYQQENVLSRKEGKILFHLQGTDGGFPVNLFSLHLSISLPQQNWNHVIEDDG
jgi:hypothetical protein